jgi:hypothetical protein
MGTDLGKKLADKGIYYKRILSDKTFFDNKGKTDI